MPRAALLALAVTLVSPLVAAPGLGAQAPAAPADAGERTLRVEGGVFLPTGDAQSMRPVPGVWVVVHRVGSGSAGALDSTRTGADGRYALSYRRPAADSAIHFVSAAYAGITYFSAPLPAEPVSGGAADLVVYDTTSRGAALRLRGRHLVLGARDSSRLHPVVEVFEIANDSMATVVARGDEPTWRIRLPERAQGGTLAGGDVSPQAAQFEDGELRVFSPFAPGVKQISIAYNIPAAAFPVSIPVRDTIALLEVLLEEEQGTVDGALLEPADSVDIDGRIFRRWVAREAPSGAVVRLGVPAPPRDSRTVYVVGILIALGMLMLLALGRSVRRPAPVPVGWNGSHGPDADELARRIAALDAAFQRRRAPSEVERQEYERRRGGLKAQLADALARDDG